jgi:hypothetical protein
MVVKVRREEEGAPYLRSLSFQIKREKKQMENLIDSVEWERKQQLFFYLSCRSHSPQVVTMSCEEQRFAVKATRAHKRKSKIASMCVVCSGSANKEGGEKQYRFLEIFRASLELLHQSYFLPSSYDFLVATLLHWFERAELVQNIERNRFL